MSHISTRDKAFAILDVARLLDIDIAEKVMVPALMIMLQRGKSVILRYYHEWVREQAGG